MTAFDRFDPFSGRVSTALEEIAPATRPAYLDEVLAAAAGTRQRRRWTFVGRWIPTGLANAVPARIGGVPTGSLVVLLLVLLLAFAAAVVWVGSNRRSLAPFGPAGNGTIIYSHDGDLWIRDTLAGTGRLLYAAPGDQLSASYSPDGRWVSFVTAGSDADHFSVMTAEGTDVREIGLIPKSGNAQAAWRPD